MELRLDAADIAQLLSPPPNSRPIIRNVRGTPPMIEADVDLASHKETSPVARIAAAIAPVIAISAALVSFQDGIARVKVSVKARRIPLVRLIGALIPLLDRLLVNEGSQPGLIRRGERSDEFLVDLATIAHEERFMLRSLRVENGQFVVVATPLA